MRTMRRQFLFCFHEIRPHSKRTNNIEINYFGTSQKRGNFYVYYTLENNFAKLCGTIHQLIVLIRRTFGRCAINIKETAIHLVLASHIIAFAILSHRMMRVVDISGAKKDAINKVKSYTQRLSIIPAKKIN